MANSAPSGIVIEYDNAGGSLVDITQHVLELGDVSVESISEEVHSFGDLWEEHKNVGLGRVPAIELSGLYDDVAATGPDALFAGRAPEAPTVATRTLKITWRTGKTTTVETILTSYTRTPDRGALTRYTATLQPTGAVVEA